MKYRKWIIPRAEPEIPDGLLEADGANWSKNLRLLAKALSPDEGNLFMDEETAVDAP